MATNLQAHHHSVQSDQNFCYFQNVNHTNCVLFTHNRDIQHYSNC